MDANPKAASLLWARNAWRIKIFWLAGTIIAVVLGFTATVCAQTDEIQVYDAEINKPGQFSVTWQNNYTAIGRKQSAFPGGIVPNHDLNGNLEWAYGVTDWLEPGVMSPVYSLTGNTHLLYDASRIRALLVVPDAHDRAFFYGVNFELGYNTRHWDQSRWAGEIRPIAGYRIGPVDLIFNPILDTAFDGIAALDFAPAERVAYNFSETRAGALELYEDFGRLKDIAPVEEQGQTLFVVVDYKGEPDSVEFGVGHGFTAASDTLIFKLMLTHTF